jgi:hypothetical protein
VALGPPRLTPVSLASFQRALADLAASPALCLAARRDPGVFDRYQPTPRERRRLEDVVRQRGMSTHCTLYRVHRITPLYTMLGCTCFLLGERLLGLVEAFWAEQPESDLQHLPEVDRFADFLRARLASGELQDPYLEEVLAFEQALNELKLAPGAAGEGGGPWPSEPAPVLDPRVRLLTFKHDPAVLLGHIALESLPPEPLPAGLYFLMMRAEGGGVSFETIDPGRAAAEGELATA